MEVTLWKKKLFTSVSITTKTPLQQYFQTQQLAYCLQTSTERQRTSKKTFQSTKKKDTKNYLNADVDVNLENGTYVRIEILSATYNNIDGTYIYNPKKIKVIEMDDEDMNQDDMNENDNNMNSDSDNDSDYNGMNSDQDDSIDNDSDNDGMNKNS